VSEPSQGKGRLKAGCSQDWLPHKLGGMASRIKKYAALGTSACATSADDLCTHKLSAPRQGWP
jgi:hypothetical protein